MTELSTKLIRIFHTSHETPTNWSAGLQPALGNRTRKAGYQPALRGNECEISGLRACLKIAFPECARLGRSNFRGPRSLKTRKRCGNRASLRPGRAHSFFSERF